jgi:hypothetical protein
MPDHSLRAEWKKLAKLAVVALTLVVVSLTWSAWRHEHAGPPLPVLIPGAVIQPPAR